MKRTILVCGHGPGISDAVAHHFGREGFAVGIVARNRDRLAKAEASLKAAGVTAKSFVCDLGDVDAVKAMVKDARSTLGPVTTLHWNAYASGAGDMMTSPVSELRTVLDVCVHGLVAAVRECREDLKAQKGSLLVTGGGFAFYDAQVNAMAVQWSSMGLAVGKAAQHKTVGLLQKKLASDGIYVGEVVVLGMVKGTAFDSGNATLDPKDIAKRFWDLDQKRDDFSVNVG
ncbi:MAG: SDR family NAD(P)-dependent oxidoreductase [Polyangiaceae bacterium]